MSSDQARSVQTVADLKRVLQQYPDDSKVAWGDSSASTEGLAIMAAQNRLIFNQDQQART